MTSASCLAAGGVLTEREFLHAQWLRIRPSSRRALVLVLALALVVVPTLVVVAAIWPGVTASVVALDVAFPFLIRASWRRAFRRASDAAVARSWEFDDVEIRWRARDGVRRVPWSEVRWWRESATLFLACHASRRLHVVVPKHWLGTPDAVDRLRALLRSRVG